MPNGLQQIQYEYINGELYYRRTVNGVASSYLLLTNNEEVTINEFSILQEIGQDWQGETCTKSITARIIFTVDNKTFPVTATSAPRRNQLY